MVVEVGRSELEFAASGCSTDACLDALTGFTRDGAGPQVANLTGQKRNVASVTDPHATTVGRVETGVLGDPEQRRRAVSVDNYRLASLPERDRAACDVSAERRESGSEALHVEMTGPTGRARGGLDGIEK